MIDTFFGIYEYITDLLFVETMNVLRRGIGIDESVEISGSVDVTVDADNCATYSHILIVTMPNVGIPRADNCMKNDFTALPLNVICKGKLLRCITCKVS